MTNPRDSIDIQPTDIPWTVSKTQTPQSCFADSNITVYAIPILPLPEPLENSSISEHANSVTTPPNSGSPSIHLPLEKRKRDSSVETSRKRRNPGGKAPGGIILSDELLEAIKQKNIDPSTLTGSVAEEFRRVIVKAMFPNTKPNPVLDAGQKKEQKRKSNEGMRAKDLGKNELSSLDNCRTDYTYA